MALRDIFGSLDTNFTSVCNQIEMKLYLQHQQVALTFSYHLILQNSCNHYTDIMKNIRFLPAYKRKKTRYDKIEISTHKGIFSLFLVPNCTFCKNIKKLKH